MIRLNLVKKAQAFYGEDWSTLNFFLTPAGNVNSAQQKIIIYKDTVIKGWMGRFMLSGNPKMMKLDFDAGIGSKNSQGFGLYCLAD